jgi:hypothetical protein
MEAYVSTDLASPLVKLLVTNGPAGDRADKMNLYGWLVGAWSMDAIVHLSDGRTQTARGQISCDWALEGRALQDVWALPPFFYGTTLRVYDPGIDAWHIIWSDPLRQYYCRQVGRRVGAEIVQRGMSDDGVATRWRFTEIAPDSFRWLGEESPAGESGWRLRADFQARRV